MNFPATPQLMKNAITGMHQITFTENTFFLKPRLYLLYSMFRIK